MDILSDDPIIVIIRYLDELDAVHFCMTCKRFLQLIRYIKFGYKYGFKTQLKFRYNFTYYTKNKVDHLYQIAPAVRRLDMMNKPIQDISCFENLEYLRTTDPPILNFKFLEYLHIFTSNDYQLIIKSLPSSLKTLILMKFNQPIEDLKLACPNLDTLEIEGNFNYPIDQLPSKLRRLQLNGQFNQPIDNLSSSLKSLALYGAYTLPIFSLPLNLTSLSLSDRYNSKLTIPSKLTFLFINGIYNQPIDFPPDSCLKQLRINGEFNQPLNLPNGLQGLWLSGMYNYPFDGYESEDTYIGIENELVSRSSSRLPDSLEILHLGYKFTCDLKYLPLGLKELYVINDIELSLPANLKELHLTRFNLKFPDLNPNLLELSMSMCQFQNSLNGVIRTSPNLISLTIINGSIPMVYTLDNLIFLEIIGPCHFDGSLTRFPRNLKVLHIYDKLDVTMETLPTSLEKLTLHNNFNRPICGYLYPNLKYLSLGNSYNSYVDSLPPKLETLKLGWIFNQPVNHLPETLLHLSFENDFDQPIYRLPKGIKSIVFGDKFNQSVDWLENLNELRKLVFGKLFDQKIQKLPESLEKLEFSREYRYKQCINQIAPKYLNL